MRRTKKVDDGDTVKNGRSKTAAGGEEGNCG